MRPANPVVHDRDGRSSEPTGAAWGRATARSWVAMRLQRWFQSALSKNLNNHSNRFSAWASSAPFFRPAQPISGTDSTSWPGRSRRSRQSRFSSSRILTSGRLQQPLARFLQDGNHLVPPHAGEPLEEIVNRIAGLQVVEEALHRHPRADEHRRAPEDVRVRMNDRFQFHAQRLPRFPAPIKADERLRPLQRRRFDAIFPTPHSVAMTIALAKDMEDFLQEQVRAGVCADASELVNDVLRSLREQQIKPFEVTPELEAWLLTSADQPVTPLTGEDFAAIRQRVRARTPSAAS